MNLSDVDILQATDAELRVLAGRAMGARVWWSERARAYKTCCKANAPGSLDDAVALAEQVGRAWTVDFSERYGALAAVWPARSAHWSDKVKGKTPAQALTRAVLLALQAQQ